MAKIATVVGVSGPRLEGARDPLRENEQKQHQRDSSSRFCYVKEAIRHYQESATIHGVVNVLGPQIYCFRRPLWTVLVIVMTSMTAWTLYNQIKLLREHPIKTDTKVSLRDHLPFPAVTICSLNQYHRQRVPNDPMTRNVIFYQSEFAQLTDAFSRLNPSDLDNLIDVSGDELLNMSLYAAPRIEELFYLCEWQAQRYKCADLFEPVNTTSGTCYVFNADKINPRLATGSGDRQGLWLILDYDNGNSYYSQDIQAGVKTIRLPYPYKAFSNHYCEDTKKEGYVNRLSLFEDYSNINCQAQCLFDYLIKTCGCRSYFDPGSFNKSELLACACTTECEVTAYSADLDFANFASFFVQKESERLNVSRKDALV
ncbi:acid-sensing ion channel 1-like [Plakobranchus ocellatus]|uniref:Acid-sensing ion channel 1-like n=1 Tax=Plakobranchus ocellatus TaxID=259542 RepID=A0AAV4DW62_9GAST|nr:acid-sensing ion channel 1-like [Plakobranchus ocellatus]